VRVAAIQFKPEKGNKDASWQALLAMCAAAGERGAQLIVCPEMAVSGYLFENAAAALEIAEPQDGEGRERLGELAQRYRAYIVCGYAERATAERGTLLYNSARILGPDGALVYNYRKRLLYDSDTTWAAPGDTPYPLLYDQLFPGGLSVGICMDLNDDRFTDFLRQEKPRLVAFCTNWLDEGVDVLPYWRYRLLGVQGYFLAANTYGFEEAPGHKRTRFCGRSTILGPKGEVLARAPRQGNGVLLVDLPIAVS
jgi:predicted amidohydrolase